MNKISRKEKLILRSAYNYECISIILFFSILLLYCSQVFPSSRNVHRIANVQRISLALTPNVKIRAYPLVCVLLIRNAKFWILYHFVPWSVYVHQIHSPILTDSASRLVSIDLKKILLYCYTYYCRSIWILNYNYVCVIVLGNVECHLDQDCTNQERCQDGRCVDACLTIQCGFNAQCKSTSHTGICFCSQDFTGNAYIECLRGM